MNPTEEKTAPRSDFFKELTKLVLLAVIVVVPFRLYIAQPFIVDGASMDPTFDSGEYLIVDELTYHFHTPERGSVVIFKYPLDPKKFFIKRVIGLPGETVSVRGGTVEIINAENPDGFTLEETYVEFRKNDNLSYTLGEAEYFVLGDNRAQSADSRSWGPLPAANIIGRPIIRFFPPDILPGDARDYQGESTNQND